jgi:hypothetical protein
MNGVAKATNSGVSNSEMIVSNLRSGISKMQMGCPAGIQYVTQSNQLGRYFCGVDGTGDVVKIERMLREI